MVKLKIRKIKPTIVEGNICDHALDFPIPEEYREMLTPILDKEPAAEVIIEEGKISIAIPKSGEFSSDYVTPPPEREGENRTIFRTRIQGKGKVRIRLGSN
jgi:hypothetical protein